MGQTLDRIELHHLVRLGRPALVPWSELGITKSGQRKTLARARASPHHLANSIADFARAWPTPNLLYFSLTYLHESARHTRKYASVCMRAMFTCRGLDSKAPSHICTNAQSTCACSLCMLSNAVSRTHGWSRKCVGAVTLVQDARKKVRDSALALNVC